MGGDGRGVREGEREGGEGGWGGDRGEQDWTGGCSDRRIVWSVGNEELVFSFSLSPPPTEQCKRMKPAVEESIAALQR